MDDENPKQPSSEGNKTPDLGILRSAELESCPQHRGKEGEVGSVRAPSSNKAEMTVERDVQSKPRSAGPQQKEDLSGHRTARCYHLCQGS